MTLSGGLIVSLMVSLVWPMFSSSVPAPLSRAFSGVPIPSDSELDFVTAARSEYVCPFLFRASWTYAPD